MAEVKHAEDVAAIIDRCLMAKDQGAFEEALILFVVVGGEDPKAIDSLAVQRLEAMPHEVQVWWRGECNCRGHLN